MSEQLKSYLGSAVRQQKTNEQIHKELAKAGWQPDQYNHLLEKARKAEKHRVPVGIGLILSPLLLLLLVLVLQVIVRVLVAQEILPQGVMMVVNIFSFLLGVIATPMLIIGPILGAVRISKK
jgi:hypothetical protein